MTSEGFIPFENEKATAFNIFTALLCQPTEDLPADESIFSSLISSLEIICPASVSAALGMKEKIKAYTQTELLVEYTRLFIGPFKLLVPPYSSMYFGSKELMSDETLWVINFYDKMGLAFDTDIKDSPDHIAVETEFLYYLTFNCIKEFSDGNTDNAHKFWMGQTEFFFSHYQKWVPQFCAGIKEHSNNAFYISMADCLAVLVNEISNPTFPQE